MMTKFEEQVVELFFMAKRYQINLNNVIDGFYLLNDGLEQISNKLENLTAEVKEAREESNEFTESVKNTIAHSIDSLEESNRNLVGDLQNENVRCMRKGDI